MKIKFNRLQWLVHIGSLLPLFVLIFDGLTNNLTVNPIQEITQRTGRIAVLWLIFSLSCTPLNILFGLKVFNRVRRPLGLYAAFYAAIHFLTYAVLDYSLNLRLIFKSIEEKPFIVVGSTALLILLLLTLTSTNQAIKKMGKNWTTLHRSVYIAGILILVHYIWAIKLVTWLPIFYSILLGLLFIVRIKPIRLWFVKRQPPWGKSVNKFLMGSSKKKKAAVSIHTSPSD